MKFILRHNKYRAGAQMRALKIIGGCKGAAEFDKETGLSKIHDDCLHRGAVVEIGSFQNEAELRRASGPDRDLVHKLRVAQAISSYADPEEVKHIEDTIVIDKKREENAAKRDKQAAGSDAAEALLKLDTVQKKLDAILGNPKVQALLAKEGA